MPLWNCIFIISDMVKMWCYYIFLLDFVWFNQGSSYYLYWSYTGWYQTILFKHTRDKYIECKMSEWILLAKIILFCNILYLSVYTHPNKIDHINYIFLNGDYHHKTLKSIVLANLTTCKMGKQIIENWVPIFSPQHKDKCNSEYYFIH